MAAALERSRVKVLLLHGDPWSNRASGAVPGTKPREPAPRGRKLISNGHKDDKNPPSLDSDSYLIA